MRFQKPLAYFFLITAGLGIFFSIFGIVQIWRMAPIITGTVTGTLDVAADTLAATENGLAVIDDVLTLAEADIAIFQSTTHTLTQTIADTGGVLESVSSLAGNDLPDTISATKTSLSSAQTSAAIIDDTLSALASIPLLGLGSYRPEVPLSDALGDISTSLDPLTPTLVLISDDMSGVVEDMEAFSRDMESLSETIGNILLALDGAGEVVSDYQAVVTDLSTRVDYARAAAPGNIRMVAWFLTALMAALLFSQIGLGERGYRLLVEMRSTPPETE